MNHPDALIDVHTDPHTIEARRATAAAEFVRIATTFGGNGWELTPDAVTRWWFRDEPRALRAPSDHFEQAVEDEAERIVTRSFMRDARQEQP